MQMLPGLFHAVAVQIDLVVVVPLACCLPDMGHPCKCRLALLCWPLHGDLRFDLQFPKGMEEQTWTAGYDRTSAIASIDQHLCVLLDLLVEQGLVLVVDPLLIVVLRLDLQVWHVGWRCASHLALPLQYIEVGPANVKARPEVSLLDDMLFAYHSEAPLTATVDMQRILD